MYYSVKHHLLRTKTSPFLQQKMMFFLAIHCFLMFGSMLLSPAFCVAHPNLPKEALVL